MHRMLFRKFFAAYSAYDSFEGKSNALTWLMAILNRKVADFYRKNINLNPISDSIIFLMKRDHGKIMMF